MKSIFIIPVLFFFFISCRNEVTETKASDFFILPNPQNTTPVIIDVQPFDDLPQKHVDYVFEALKNVYPNMILKKAIPLPKQAYYEPRKRYKADTIIAYLGSKTPEGHVTIGLTTKDISTSKGNYKDWGVMGLFLPDS